MRSEIYDFLVYGLERWQGRLVFLAGDTDFLCRRVLRAPEV